MQTIASDSQVGNYRIGRKLGEGGMGAVFEAVHLGIGRTVAIKVLLSEHARNREIATRFFNEARAVNLITHPGLVQVSDFGQLPDGTAYLVMELLKGESLSQRLAKSGGRLPLSQSLQLGWQLADTLAAVHASGVVHRDLKPSNIMLVPDPHMALGERAKILDFGIAKLTEEQAPLKTKTNQVMGTPAYMSPEQCQGAGRVDSRSDVYSLGAILFEMLAGHPPFVAEGAGELIGMHLFMPAPSLSVAATWVPSAVSQLVDRLLEKDRERRPSMRELAGQLQALAGQQISTPGPTPGTQSVHPYVPSTLDNAAVQTRKRSRQRFVAASGAGLTVVLLAGVLWISRNRPEPTKPVVSAHGLQSAARGIAAPNGHGENKFPSHDKQQRWESDSPRAEGTKSVAMVELRVDSEPSSATVFRAQDNHVLGTTPWVFQQPPAAGHLRIRLHLDGYQDQELLLSTSRSSEVTQPLKRIPPKAIEPRTGVKGPLPSTSLGGHGSSPSPPANPIPPRARLSTTTIED